jgi:hypothetical protein
VVELVQPLSTTTLEGRDLEQNGDGIHSLIFRTSDLGKASDHLRAKGMRPSPTATTRSSSGRTRRSGWSSGSPSAGCPTTDGMAVA